MLPMPARTRQEVFLVRLGSSQIPLELRPSLYRDIREGEWLSGLNLISLLARLSRHVDVQTGMPPNGPS